MPGSSFAGAIGIASTPIPAAPQAAAPTPPVAAPPAAPAATGQGRGAATPAPVPAPVVVLADRDVQNLSGQKVALTITQRGAQKLFTGSAHTMEDIGQLARDGKQLPRFDLPGRLKVQASVTRETFESSNVAGLFEGSDPVLKSEVVVMTSHLDHVGIGRAFGGETIYNGAMDDAS